MIFSRASEYAIQGMLYLARISNPAEKAARIEQSAKGEISVYVQTKEIAESHDIPYYFLAKIVQDLARAGLIISSKGPTGGIALSRPAGEIAILDIIAAVDSTKYLSRCVIGFPDCKPEEPCPLHYEWQTIKERIFTIIEGTTLAELVETAVFRNGRLIVPLTKGVVSVELPMK